ncbi:MAG: DEAD/DEAH box helicase, partial [Oscillospiraceae bacterium]
MNKQEILKQYFGHEQFRNGQAELIDALVSGRDVLGVMPTGAGKSACYQIPALLLPGITLVISPLISLMKDQVAALTLAGIPSAFINSSLSAAEYRYVFDEAESGAYKIIYVAPERLTAGDFLRFAKQAKISLVAVDEAHCISQW